MEISKNKKSFNSQERTLALFWILFRGGEVSLEQAAVEYGVSPHTIKHDISKIRAVFDLHGMNLLYDSKHNVYRMDTNDYLLSMGDAFIIHLMLYQSRCLPKEELEDMLSKVRSSFDVSHQMKLKRLFQSYDYHYTSHQTAMVRDKINMITRATSEQRVLSFAYQKRNRVIERKVAPLAIAYHNGAFYMTAFRMDHNEDFPLQYRLDRMEHCLILEERFRVDKGKDFFSAGEFTKRSYNMFVGEPIKVRMKVIQWLEEYVHREFPQAVTIRSDDTHAIMEVEALGMEGVVYWILSQQDRVEVVSPPALRSKVKELAKKIYSIYAADPDDAET